MIMEVGKCICLQNKGVVCLYWSSFSPFWSIYKPFWFIVSSFLRDIFDLGPVPYSIFRSVPWNVIKPRKCEKRNIGQEYGAVQWIGMHRGRVQEYKERHLSCQQLVGPCSSKLKGCGRNPFFLCFVLFLFGNSFNRELRFFFKFVCDFLAFQLVTDYWSFSSIIFSFYCHPKIYIYTTNRVLLERKKLVNI